MFESAEVYGFRLDRQGIGFFRAARADSKPFPMRKILAPGLKGSRRYLQSQPQSQPETLPLILANQAIVERLQLLVGEVLDRHGSTLTLGAAPE